MPNRVRTATIALSLLVALGPTASSSNEEKARALLTRPASIAAMEKGTRRSRLLSRSSPTYPETETATEANKRLDFLRLASDSRGPQHRPTTD